MTTTNLPSNEFDIAIIGSGLAGSVLAAVLARARLRVVMVDAGQHPRFAIGESMTPQAATLLRVIADRYDVPELHRLASFQSITAGVTTSCGVKRHDGFRYAREAERPRPAEAHGLVLGGAAAAQSHLFRQDIDAWLFHLAVSYGARMRQRVTITGVDIDDTGVTLTAEHGEAVRASYVVDTSGPGSPLAANLDLREKPTRLRHHSRSLATHMLAVPSPDQTMPGASSGQPGSWLAGTVRYVFPGGWLWDIPFGNHPHAVNGLTSVGLNLDTRLHGDGDGSPEEEFRAFVARYPGMSRQFAGAKTIRPWVRSGRAQYSSHTTAGPRWCVIADAAGFVDTLFSRDLGNSLEMVNALAGRLLEAVKADDFSAARFTEVQKTQQALLDFTDDLVASAYVAFRDYRLWDAWFRVWATAELLSICELNRTYAGYLAARDSTVLARLEGLAPGGWLPGQAQSLLTEASDRLRAVEESAQDPATAATAIKQAVAAADFVPPALRLAEPAGNWLDLNPASARKIIRWARDESPPEIGQLVAAGLRPYAERGWPRRPYGQGPHQQRPHRERPHRQGPHRQRQPHSAH
jgi:tetracycline 7-halogenase / FADH2 O2-dependent halogenase